MGLPIANDADSVSKRASSSTGFIDEDLPLLRILRVIEKKRGVEGVNNNLVNDPSEIRDFLTWASGDKKVPLPPLARRILCLKRGIIKNSIASVGTALQQRTGEKKQLEEIDAILRSDGVTDPDCPEQCETEGSKWVPIMHAGVDPAPAAVPAAAPAAVPSTSGTGAGCTTIVNCDSSAVVALITDIKSKLEKITPGTTGSKEPSVNLTSITTLLESIEDKINKLPKKRCQCPLPTIPMGTHIKNKEGRQGTVIKYKLFSQCGASAPTPSPGRAPPPRARPAAPAPAPPQPRRFIVDGRLQPPAPQPPAPQPPAPLAPQPPAPQPPAGNAGTPLLLENAPRANFEPLAVVGGGNDKCDYLLVVKWDDDGTVSTVNPLNVEYAPGFSVGSAPSQLRVGDVVSRIDNEPLTNGTPCRKGSVTSIVGNEVTVECIDEPAAPAAPAAPARRPPPPPRGRPAHFVPNARNGRIPTPGGSYQHGGVASIRQLSPTVSVYAPNDLVKVQNNVDYGVVQDLNQMLMAYTIGLGRSLEKLDRSIVSVRGVRAVVDDIREKTMLIGRGIYMSYVHLKDLLEANFTTLTDEAQRSAEAIQQNLDAILALRVLIEDVRDNMITIPDIAVLLDRYRLGDIPGLLEQIQATQASHGRDLASINRTLNALVEEDARFIQMFQAYKEELNAKLVVLETTLEPIARTELAVGTIQENLNSLIRGVNLSYYEIKELLDSIKRDVKVNDALLVAGEINEILDIVKGLKALIEQQVKISDIKRLLDDYHLGDTNALLLSIQSLVQGQGTQLTSIQRALAEIKPHIDEIPALKTLVESIEQSMAKGEDVSLQLSGLQTLLTSYELQSAVPLLEEITSWLDENTIETQLEDVKESLDDILSLDPTDAIKNVQTAIDAVLPKLEVINASLSEQLSSIKNDTTTIRAGVEGLSTNTKTRDEALLAKIAEQTSMISEMKQNIDELGYTLKETTTATFEDTESIKRKLHRLKNLIAVTHTPETEEAAVERVLQTYNSKLSEKIAGLQATNKQGKNNASLARVAELEDLVRELQARLQEENEHKVSVRDKEASIEELEEQISTLQSNSAKKNGRVSELTLQTADRQAQIEAKTAEIVQLKQEIASLKTNYDGQLREAAVASEQLTREIEALQEAASATAAQLAEKERTSAAGVKAEANEKNLILNEQEESINRLRAEGKETNRLLDEAKASLAEITSAKTALEEELRVADGQLEQCSEALREALRSKNQELASRNLAYTEMVKKLNEEREAAIASFIAATNTSNIDAAANALIKAKDDEVQEYKIEKEEDAALIKKLTELVKNLEREVQEKAAVEADLARCRSELEALKLHLAELVAQKDAVLEQVRSELSSAKGKIAELEPEVEQLRSQKLALDKEISTVKASLAELESRGGPKNLGEVANPFSNHYVPPPSTFTNYTRNNKNKRTKPQKYTQENLRVLTDGLKQFIKYANKGGSNSLIPDVNGMILNLQDSFNNKSYQNFRIAWSKLMQSPTGRAIADIPRSPVAPYKNIERILPNTYEDAFHNLVKILTIVPEAVSGYKTRFGGLRRTIKKSRDYRKAQ